MSYLVGIYVIGNDLEIPITITKNVSHNHSRSWSPILKKIWATICDLIWSEMIGDQDPITNALGNRVYFVTTYSDDAVPPIEPICLAKYDPIHNTMFFLHIKDPLDPTTSTTGEKERYIIHTCFLWDCPSNQRYGEWNQIRLGYRGPFLRQTVWHLLGRICGHIMLRLRWLNCL